MPVGPRLIAFIHSSHLGTSHAFYSGVLGLTRTDATPMANEYDAHGTTLRVMLVPEHRPSRFTVLGWRVPDLEVAMADLAGRGLQFKRYEGFEADENAVWSGPRGVRQTWFEDPDGNIISLGALPEA